MSTFYAIFNHPERNTRAHKQYPELRPGGWVTIVVSPGKTADFEAYLAEEDKAREIATQYFGTAWSHVTGQLSFDDFRQGELMVIDCVEQPGLVVNHEIVMRKRFLTDGGTEELTGTNLVVAQAQGAEDAARPAYRSIRFGGGTVEPQVGIDILKDVETSPQSSEPQFLVRTWDGLWAWIGNPEYRPETGRAWADVAGLASALEPFGTYGGVPKAGS